jgi:ferrous iron transport protein B
MNAWQALATSRSLGRRVGQRAESSEATVRLERLPVVALVGRPNVGKSTFVARLTGRYEEVANLPGTTVGTIRRQVRVDGRDIVLVDLPGAHSLTDRSDGLPAFWQLLLDARPDAVLSIVDAGQLALHLPLVLACRDLGLPIVVAANLADEAEAHGVELDLGRLSQLLSAPVHRTVGRRGSGVREALIDAVRLAEGRREAPDDGVPQRWIPPYGPEVVRAVGGLAARLRAGESRDDLEPAVRAGLEAGTIGTLAAATITSAARLEPERWTLAANWAAQVEGRDGVRRTLADRLGRVVTSPKVGLPLFAIATLGALWMTMAVGTIIATALSSGWSTFVSPIVTNVVRAVVPVPVVSSTLLWALDSGLLSMLAVGIPFVLTFYLVIAALEDSGYLASTAVLSDRIFNALGLPGRAAIPLLAATGCNVPAIYATRVLHSRRERLLASFLVSLTPCSASSAVVVAALSPYVGMGAALGAFAVIAVVVIVAGLGANAVLPGRQSPLVLELPPLRLPIPRQVLAKAWHRFRSFVTTATPVMLGGSLVIGALYETGAITPIEVVLAPISTGLLGLPPVAGIALALAVLRKELALQLLLTLAIAQFGLGARSLISFMSPGQLLVFAVVTGLSVPCVATIGALAGEFGWRPALAVSGATLVTALGTGAVVARLVGVA